MSKIFTLVVSGLLYVVSLALPLFPPGEGSGNGATYFLMGGYFFIGAPLIPANLLFLLGWIALWREKRRPALLLALTAVLVGIGGGIPLLNLQYEAEALHYPAYWVWMASFVILALGAFLLPKSPSTRDDQAISS